MQTNYKTLRLILGDQLDSNHSWFNTQDSSVLYVMIELNQELEVCWHHHQKIVAFLSAMHSFSQQLNANGHDCLYLDLDELAKSNLNQKSLPIILEHIANQHSIKNIHYQQPDEYRLLDQLKQWQSHQTEEGFNIVMNDTEHFLLPKTQIPKQFKAGKAVRMEAFYRRMRKSHQILMSGQEHDQPLGGAWNYDSKNRQSFKQADLENIPAPCIFENDAHEINIRLSRHNVKSIGKQQALNIWPCNRHQSLLVLDYFCEYLLPNFGKFQDAMTTQTEHAWSLYHSRLSFALNTKMLSPKEVITKALNTYEASNDIDLAQIEGFIRQILGWREYIRAMYWINMPNYASMNALKAERDLPEWFWSGQTKMNCLSKSIEQSLDYAYAHHIQRLMITGNFALLAGIDPSQVDNWYLGIYIDAIEWVERPNTRGMA